MFTIDGGPKDLPVQFFMPANGFRTMWFYDPQHKGPRDMFAAASACKIWTDVLDVTFALNWASGPFKSQAWFAKAQGAAKEYVQKASADDDMLTFAYEDICRDRGADRDVAFGEPEHYEEVLKSLSPEHLFKK